MRVVISGIRGRMGRLVADEVVASRDLTIVAGVERPGHPDVGRPAGEVWGPAGPDAPVVDDVRRLGDGFDVLIDFSSPEQATDCAGEVAALGKGLVIGTTGLSDEQRAAIAAAAETCRVVLAPNMSLGVSVLERLVRLAARSLGDDFDVEIVEEHHRAKRDAPSGTAARLLEVAASGRGLDPAAASVYGRHGAAGPRRTGEIGVHAVRGGGIVGRHSVRFISEVEEVVVEHEALSRRVFARGAVAAARFAGQGPPGLYTMADVIEAAGR